MIYSVQYLRGIAALLIVMFHFHGFLNNVYDCNDLGTILFNSGQAGVDLFFIISGFIVVTSTRAENGNDPLSFAIKRLFRVYPLLIAGVLAYALTWWDFETVPDSQTLVRMAKGMLALNLDYNGAAPFFGYNFLYPAWTISYEVFFYAMFAVALSFSHRWRGWIAAAAILSFCFGLQLYFNGSFRLSADIPLNLLTTSFLTGIVKLAASPMVLEFVFGMALAGVYHSLPTELPEERLSSLKRAAVLACWVGAGLYIFFYFTQTLGRYGLFGYGVWASVVMIPALAHEKLHGMKPNRVLMFFGEISYALYLSHVIVMTFFNQHYPRYFPAYSSITGVSRIVFLTVVSIGVAYVAHRVIERPCMNLARRLLKSRSRIDEEPKTQQVAS